MGQVITSAQTMDGRILKCSNILPRSMAYFLFDVMTSSTGTAATRREGFRCDWVSGSTPHRDEDSLSLGGASFGRGSPLKMYS